MNGQPKTGRSGASVIVRSVLWIVISSVFLVGGVRGVMARHTAGQMVGWWLYAQVLIWAAALVFWFWTGWCDLKRRDSPDGNGRGIS